MKFLPENISTYGGDLDSLTVTIFWFALVWFLIAALLMIFFMIRYRSKEGQKASYITGNDFSQAKWIWLILILVTISDGYIDVKNLAIWDKIEIQSPKADVEVKITGTMWNWVFSYPGPDGKLDTPDDIIVEETDSSLYVPVNKNVVMHLASRDVLHAFFVKEIRLTQDVIPGRTIKRWFNATKTGKFELACKEICGAGHGDMRNFLVVQTQEEYDATMASLYGQNKTQELAAKDL